MLQALSAVPVIVGALILRTDRGIVAELRAMRALTAATATEISQRRTLTRWRLARLIQAGAVGTNGVGGVYLDEAKWNAYRRRRRRRVLIVVAAVIPFALVVTWVLGRR